MSVTAGTAPQGGGCSHGKSKITDQNNVGNLNPFRYRGYYYDTESKLTYLMSRYYDPVTHRFINADGYFQSGNAILDANMNAYCANDPVNCFDPDGTCWVPIYSTCGAQMGSKWVMNGNIPGVPYVCHKCCKNDPSYIPPPNPPKPEPKPKPKPKPVPAPSTSKYFDTTDEAAINFVLLYGAESISSCREYAAPINQVTINGKIMYTIGKLDIGPVRTGADGRSSVTWDESTVAYVHTHGQYVVPENNQFSNVDKDFKYRYSIDSMLFAYVGTPSGVVRKYDFGTGSDVIIFNNAPR